MIKIGVTGFPFSGKSTLLEVLKLSEGSSHVHGKIQVRVPDSRLEKLAKIYRPEKITHMSVEFEEIGSLGDGGVPGEVFSKAQEVDVILVILKNFENPTVPDLDLKPSEQMSFALENFLKRDIEVLEGKLERLRSSKRKLTNLEEIEMRVIEEALDALKKGGDLKPLGEEKSKILSGYSLTVMKPKFFLSNSGEVRIEEGVGDFDMNLKLVKDLLELDPEERAFFMEEFGLGDLGIEELLKFVLKRSGYGVFYTVKGKEMRAWGMKLGSTAVEVAGIIHSDMARGFIRAEVFRSEDLIREGSERELRNKGLVRTVGRDHIVEDGDVIYVKFNV